MLLEIIEAGVAPTPVELLQAASASLTALAIDYGGTRAASVAPPNAVQRAAAVSRDDLARAIMMDGSGY